MKGILLAIAAIFAFDLVSAQYIDKTIDEMIYENTSTSIVFDADNDGLDDFSFSYNSGSTVSVDIITNASNTGVGTFNANFAKANIVTCNTTIDANLSVTWNTLISPFNSVPFVDPQYCSSFNFSAFGQNSVHANDGGFIPIMVNGHYGYVLIDYYPISGFKVWGSRISTTVNTAVNVDCGTIGVNELNQNKNQITISSQNGHCIIRNVRDKNDLIITDITGRAITFKLAPISNSDYELISEMPAGIFLCRSKSTKQVVRFIK